MWGCSCRGRWGLSWGGNKFNTSGAWRGEGVAVYFIRWVDAGLLHAVRQVGLTGGIQQDPSCLSVDGCLRGGGSGGRLFTNLT